jgi:pSer/pThr/pTyr-binding forkhead associated (FHA) protein
LPYFEVKTPRRAVRLKLEGSFVVVGRGEPIPIFHDDPSLSRQHAAIVVSGGAVHVRDLGSKNGVQLNGKPLVRYSEVVLRPGDVLKMGATTLTLRDGEKPPVEKAVAKKAETPAVDPADLAPTMIEDDPEGEARVDRDGEPKSIGRASVSLEPPPSGDSNDDSDDDLLRTSDPEMPPPEPEPAS